MAVDAQYTQGAGLSPVIRHEVIPAGQVATDGLPYQHIKNIGLDTVKLMPIMQQRFGLQYADPNALFEIIFKHPRKTLDVLQIQNRKGTSIGSWGQVKSCNTGNGTGLSEVSLKVSGRFLDNGIDTNVPYWMQNQMILNFEGRPFKIIAVSNDADGQNITLIPTQGAYDLTVSGGNCVQFPNGSNFGGGAPLDNGMGEGCFCEYESTRSTNDFVSTRDNQFTRMKYKVVRKRSSMQEKVYAVKWDDVVDGYPTSMYAYMTEQEMEFEWDMAYARMKQIFFGKINQNVDNASLCGNGIFAQVPDDLKFNYTPGGTGSDRLTYKKLLNIIGQWKTKLRGYVGTELFMFCGSALYQEIMEIMDTQVKAPVYWTGANETLADTNRKYFLGNNWGGFHHVLGVNIAFIWLPFLDNRNIGTGAPSLTNPEPTIGRYTHTGILIDPSEMMNANLSTGNLEKQPEHKLALYGYTDPVLKADLTEVTQYKEMGRIKWDGSMPTSIADESECPSKIRESNFLANQNDDTCMMILDPNPQTF
jgi:hypothetical protein